MAEDIFEHPLPPKKKEKKKKSPTRYAHWRQIDNSYYLSDVNGYAPLKVNTPLGLSQERERQQIPKNV